MTENSSNGNPFYFDAEILKTHREMDLFLDRNKHLTQAEEEKKILNQTLEERHERVKQSLAGSDYNLIKLDNGLLINGARVNHLIDCKIDSSVDNLTEVTIKFIAKVDGLDNIDINRHSFNGKE